MKKQTYLLVVLLAIVFASCTKEEPSIKENPNIAGLGGNVEITVFPTLNGNPVWSQPNYIDSAYIKFNSLDFPGTDPALYDLKVESDLSNHIHVRGLKKGDYYFYVSGWDVNSQRRVTGGAPFTLSSTEGIFHLPIPVNP